MKFPRLHKTNHQNERKQPALVVVKANMDTKRLSIIAILTLIISSTLYMQLCVKSGSKQYHKQDRNSLQTLNTQNITDPYTQEQNKAAQEPVITPEEPIKDPEGPLEDPEEPTKEPEDPHEDPEEPIKDPEEHIKDPEEEGKPHDQPQEPLIPEEPTKNPEEEGKPHDQHITTGNNGTSSTTSSQNNPSQSAEPSKKVLVSIVVPVYNTEKYIRRSLDSLIGQTLKEIEIIIVDGTDRDNSTNIIREYAQKDPRIRVFLNTVNVGPGPSRNMGIDAAVGEYVGFVDSDDYVSPNYYEVLYKAATENKDNIYDIAKGILLEEGDDGIATFQSTSTRTAVAGEKKINEYFTYQHFTGMFSMKMLKEHPDARYGDTLSGEDLVFLNSAGYYARNLVYKEEAKYHYVHHEGSITSTDSPQKFVGVPRFYKQMVDFLKSTGDTGILRRRVSRLRGIISDELRNNKKYESSSEECLRNAYVELKAFREELNSI